MNNALHLFNPDHDLALANGDENFVSPKSARTFAADLACLPLWYAETGSMVLAEMHNQQWLEEIRRIFPQIESVSVEPQPDFSKLTQVHPWGWNAAVRKSLLTMGAGDQLLPDALQLDQIRRLSHRSMAVEAMNFLHKEEALSALLPPPAQLLSAGEVEAFASQHASVVFKAPWSGSGKGLGWARGNVSKSLLGWCRKVAEKQGCVVGEEAYDKVQDFAMEFFCSGGKVSFAGYSLFSTDNGVYKCNELMSNEAISGLLTHQWIPEQQLLMVQKRLLTFIDTQIAPFYNGFLGVDMLVFKRGRDFRLHPCVEINLRMTMGCVARIFYDRFVSPQKTGRFYIDYFPAKGALLNDHLQRQSSFPLRVINGQITQGYLSLLPLGAESHYRARVELIDNGQLTIDNLTIDHA